MTEFFEIPIKSATNDSSLVLDYNSKGELVFYKDKIEENRDYRDLLIHLIDDGHEIENDGKFYTVKGKKNES